MTNKIEFVDTRDSNDRKKLFPDLALRPSPASGGLYTFKNLTKITNLEKASYRSIAIEVLTTLFDNNSISENDINDIVDTAYGDKFYNDAADKSESILPVISLPPYTLSDNQTHEVRVAELFHGPTYSFKDFGLRLASNVTNLACKYADEHLTCVTATSGDTGGAALHAVGGLSNMSAVVIYPNDQVSKRQESQMVHIANSFDNLKLFTKVNSPSFDECQDMVKRILKNPENHKLGSLNSINIYRIIGQMIYYIYLLKNHANIKKLEDGSDSILKTEFLVPTGNFGNAMSAKYALLAVDNLKEATITAVCNENDGASCFIRTGQFTSHDRIDTNSPAMDIIRPSNIERLVFERANIINSENANDIAKSVVIDKQPTEPFTDVFRQLVRTDGDAIKIAARVLKKTGRLYCPHTCRALAAAIEPNADKDYIVLATAHFGKFQDTYQDKEYCKQFVSDEDVELLYKHSQEIPEELNLDEKLINSDIHDYEEFQKSVFSFNELKKNNL